MMGRGDRNRSPERHGVEGYTAWGGGEAKEETAATKATHTWPRPASHPLSRALAALAREGGASEYDRGARCGERE